MTRAELEFQLGKRDVTAAYVIWFVGGLLGLHKHYTRHPRAWLHTILTLTIVGAFITIPWTKIDGFLLYKWVDKGNRKLAHDCGLMAEAMTDNQQPAQPLALPAPVTPVGAVVALRQAAAHLQY